MAFRGPPPRDPEPGTFARLRRDLATAEAAILRILDAAPHATTKYKDAGSAARAVLTALGAAVRDYTEAESRWLRWRREHGDGRR
jgi:hypothetical protein